MPKTDHPSRQFREIGCVFHLERIFCRRIIPIGLTRVRVMMGPRKKSANRSAGWTQRILRTDYVRAVQDEISKAYGEAGELAIRVR